MFWKSQGISSNLFAFLEDIDERKEKEGNQYYDRLVEKKKEEFEKQKIRIQETLKFQKSDEPKTREDQEDVIPFIEYFINKREIEIFQQEMKNKDAMIQEILFLIDKMKQFQTLKEMQEQIHQFQTNTKKILLAFLPHIKYKRNKSIKPTRDIRILKLVDKNYPFDLFERTPNYYIQMDPDTRRKYGFLDLLNDDSCPSYRVLTKKIQDLLLSQKISNQDFDQFKPILEKCFNLRLLEEKNKDPQIEIEFMEIQKQVENIFDHWSNEKNVPKELFMQTNKQAEDLILKLKKIEEEKPKEKALFSFGPSLNFMNITQQAEELILEDGMDLVEKEIISFNKTHEKPKEEQKEEKPAKEEPKIAENSLVQNRPNAKIAENHDEEEDIFPTDMSTNLVSSCTPHSEIGGFEFTPRQKAQMRKEEEEETITPFRKLLWLLKSYKKCYQPLFHRAIQLDPNLPQDLAKEFEDIIFNVCEQFGDIDTAEEEENVLEEIEIPEKPKPPMKNPNMDPESYQRYCDLEDLRQRTEKGSSRFYIKQVQNLLVLQQITNQDYENILPLLQRFSEISHFDDDDDTDFNIERTKIQKQITDWINQMRKKDFLKQMDYDETAGIVVYGEEEEDFNEEEEPIQPTYETDTHRVYEHKEGNRKLIISVDKKHEQPKGYIGLMKNLPQDFKLKGGAPPKKKPQSNEEKEEKEEKPEKEEPKIAENHDEEEEKPELQLKLFPFQEEETVRFMFGYDMDMDQLNEYLAKKRAKLNKKQKEINELFFQFKQFQQEQQKIQKFQAFLDTLPDEIEVNDLVQKYNDYFRTTTDSNGIGNIKIGNKYIRDYFKIERSKKKGEHTKYKKLDKDEQPSVLHQVLKLKGGGGSLPPGLQPKFDSDGNKIEENHHEEEEGKKEQKIAENHDDEPPKSKESSLEPSKSSPIVNTKYFNKFKLDYLLKQIDDGYQKQMREKSYLHQTFTKEQYEKMISDRELMFNHPIEEDIEDVIKYINTPPPKEVSRAGLYREVYIPSEVYEKMISKEKIKTPPDKKEESVPLCRMGYPIGSPEYESYKAEMIAQMNHDRNNQLEREIFYIKEDMKLAEDYWERRNRCISRYPESNEMIIHNLTEDIREAISHDRQEVIDDIFEKMDERLNQICPQEEDSKKKEEDSKKKEEKKTSYYNKKDFQKIILLIMTFYQNMENNLILVIKDIVSKNSTNEYYYIQDRIFGSFYCLCFHITAFIEDFNRKKITLLININTPMSDLNLIKAYASSCLDLLTQQIIQELPDQLNNLYQDLYRESFNSLGREFREHGFHLMKPIPYEEESNMLLNESNEPTNESNEFQTKGPIIEEVDDEPKSQMMKYEPKSQIVPIAPKPIISQEVNEQTFQAFLANVPDEWIDVKILTDSYNKFFHQNITTRSFGMLELVKKNFTKNPNNFVDGHRVILYKKN